MNLTIKEINNQRNDKGVFSIGNEVAGWFAISRNGINMITFHEGKFTFSKNKDVNKFYSELGFAKRLNQLLNRGF